MENPTIAYAVDGLEEDEAEVKERPCCQGGQQEGGCGRPPLKVDSSLDDSATTQDADAAAGIAVPAAGAAVPTGAPSAIAAVTMGAVAAGTAAGAAACFGPLMKR